jgi:hypothetical protein
MLRMARYIAELRVKLTTEQLAEFYAAAEDAGLSASALARTLVLEYLAERDRERDR